MDLFSSLTPLFTALIAAMVTWLLMRGRSASPEVRAEAPAGGASARREQMFKKAFDAAPVGMALITPQGQWLQVNARLLKLLGYTRDEILRTSMRELTHSDDRKLEAPHARKLLAKEIASYSLDKRLMRRSRQYGLFKVSFSRFLRTDEIADELWLCIVEEASNAEEAERREEASALESLLAEMREIAMITYDPQGIIESWNVGAERVFGLAAKEILGRSRTVLYRESDVWEEKPRNDLRSAMAHRRLDCDDWRVGKDGVNLWLKVSILPDVRGDEVVRFIEICRESGQARGVDEYRQSYERLKRASEARIEELNKSIRDLEADVIRKERQSESLREALQSFRQTGEEQMAELKILTEAFRKELERRREIEEKLRLSAAERDEIAQRYETAERELRERDLVQSNVPAEAEWKSFADLPAAELFLGLATERRTGTLVLSSVSVEKKVFLEDGLIFSCTSNDPALFLGEILLREGIIDAVQHRHAVELHEETGIALGRILVMTGAVDQQSLTKAMRLKAEEEIVSVFEWSDDGRFTFIEGDPPSLQLVPVRLDIPPIVARGLRRAGHAEDAALVERGRPTRPPSHAEAAAPISTPHDEHEDWGDSVQAGIAEIHDDQPAASVPATVYAGSDEDSIVEQLLAEAEQTALELVGLGGEHYDPSLDDTQRSVVTGDETVAIRGSVGRIPGDEEVPAAPAQAAESAVMVAEPEIEGEQEGAVSGDLLPAELSPDAQVESAFAIESDASPAVPQGVTLDQPLPAEEHGAEPDSATTGSAAARGEFVASLAKKSTKYHRVTCNSVKNLADDARVWFATRADAEAAGLQACKLCRKK
ncbi:MAG: PAS domain S-box protein [Thermoanaerobaculia bacterium]|nr:PAS domain S-box protein [Thermoanaerobaculia bacterium]